ncbi:dihydrofolate reductase [Spiroplasma sp. TIUS-1]|uniref:dihydrofolate reductase n=1 Tax=Spiroplasma sp. TIUS-1 TaxID=216963 RepID=UPI0013973699|nr:dihydrofolate reductase [Spiroplasma sp. TIUS-1]QHX35986.1 dihydrofolate reductase [Spiroplasma sp. TIUS-1]
MISLIWAQTNDGVIGKDNKLPWNIKEDLKHFKNYTKGKDVLMGKNTWESLPLKPLPNRKNIIVSTKLNLDKSIQAIVETDLTKVLYQYKNSDKELVVIGGGKIYQQALDLADKLIISIIKEKYIGDTYAPTVDFAKFNEISKTEFDEFTVYEYVKKEI